MSTMTMTKMQRFIREAAQRLVNGFSNLDADDLPTIAKATGDVDFLPMPAWGTVWKVGDSCDERKIRELLTPGLPEDEAGAIDVLASNGIDLNLSERYTCRMCAEPIKFLPGTGEFVGQSVELSADDLNDPETRDGLVSVCCAAPLVLDDEDKLVQDTIEAWRESNDERAMLAGSWSNVAGTGLLAIDVDGDLYLGSNSGGHDFFDAYWIPLYLALGYEWHIQGFREDALNEAVREMCFAISHGKADRTILRLAKRVAKRRAAQGNGGPLSPAEQAEAGSA